MEELRAFLSWLSFTDLENLVHNEGFRMVEATLKVVEGEKYAPALEVIQEEFLAGGIPVDLLRAFLEEHRDLLEREEIPAAHQLEDELRDLAEGLQEEEWVTGSYLKLEQGIQQFIDGDEDVLARVIEEMEQLLDSAWGPYADTQVTESEVTMESAIGHQLLAEGVDEWWQALDKLRQEDPDWQDVLDTAQYANRILVAVDRFSERLNPKS